MNAEFVKQLQDKISSSIKVAMPAVIVSYDYKTQNASVQINIKEEYKKTFVDYPIITNVPVIFPSSGGASITMPVVKGDGCLLVFADRDINNWLLGSDNQPASSQRTHHLKDAVAIIGLNSFKKGGKAKNADDLLITYDTSDIVIQKGGKIDILSAEELNIKTKNITINCENATLNVSDKIDVKCVSLNAKCTQLVVDTETADINATGDINTKSVKFIQTGDMKISGNIEIVGNSELGGTMLVKGAVTAESSIEATGTITGGTIKTKSGKDLAAHTHSYIDSIGQPPAPTPKNTGVAQ